MWNSGIVALAHEERKGNSQDDKWAASPESSQFRLQEKYGGPRREGGLRREKTSVEYLR